MNLGPKSVSAEPADDQKSKSPHANWRLYAAAGAAALAAGSAADAAIIYTHPASPITAKNGTAINVGNNFTVGGDAVNIRLQTTSADLKAVVSGPTIEWAESQIFGTGENAYAAKFPLGQPITDKLQLHHGTLAAGTGGNRGVLGGPFTAGKTGIGGFELANGDLGWMRFEVFNSSFFGTQPTGVEAIDWAYNDIPGAPITAGDTGASVPEPSALGLLALGSAGVLAWRRRRTGAAT